LTLAKKNRGKVIYMKKILSIFVALLLVFGIAPPVKAQGANERVIVLFRNKADKNIIVQAKGRINREYRNINALAVSVPSTALGALRNNPNVIAVETDMTVRVKTQTQDWGIRRTEAPAAWSSSFTGKGVKIAVVDTGIAKHEDLIIAGGASFTSYTTSYHDDNGHGTHVAGIIGARNNGYGTVGIAHEASLYAVKVLGQDGSGYLSEVIAGIDWSITNKMDIVNLSLGTTIASTSLQQIVDKAYSQGVLVVAAAGNNGRVDGTGDTVEFPARYDSVIAVSATDSKDARASFSATGSTIEVAAPGVNIMSTYPSNRYVSMSGTSMAAPYAAGNLALLKQAYPTLSHNQLRNKLREHVVDLGTAGKDNWFGFGLIQAPKVEQTEDISQPKILDTKTTVETNKTSYLPGETVHITVRAADTEGKALSGASVKVTITPPKGRSVVYQGKTGTNGEVTFTLSTKRNSTKGTYTVKAETSAVGYSSSSDITTFELAEDTKETTKSGIEQKSTVEKNLPVAAAKAEEVRKAAQQKKDEVQSMKIEAQTKNVEAQEKSAEKKEAVQDFRKTIKDKQAEIKELSGESSALRIDIGKKREELDAILEELVAGTKTLSDELLAHLIDEAAELKGIGDIVKSLNGINDEVVAAEDKIKEKNFDSALAALDRVTAKQQQRLEALKELNKGIDRLLEIARQAQIPAEDDAEEISDDRYNVDVIKEED
jgi:minor extracellular protease Epr